MMGDEKYTLKSARGVLCNTQHIVNTPPTSKCPLVVFFLVSGRIMTKQIQSQH